MTVFLEMLGEIAAFGPSDPAATVNTDPPYSLLIDLRRDERVDGHMQIPPVGLPKLAARAVSASIVKRAVVTQVAFEILAIRALGAHGRARFISKHRNLSRRQIRFFMVLVADPPLATSRQIELIAEHDWLDLLALLVEADLVRYPGVLVGWIQTLVVFIPFNHSGPFSGALGDGDCYILVAVSTASLRVGGRIADGNTAIAGGSDAQSRRTLRQRG